MTIASLIFFYDFQRLLTTLALPDTRRLRLKSLRAAPTHRLPTAQTHQVILPNHTIPYRTPQGVSSGSRRAGDDEHDELTRQESYDKWVIKTGVKNMVIDQMATAARDTVVETVREKLGSLKQEDKKGT